MSQDYIFGEAFLSMISMKPFVLGSVGFLTVVSLLIGVTAIIKRWGD